jgi:hypothetical protein
MHGETFILKNVKCTHKGLQESQVLLKSPLHKNLDQMRFQDFRHITSSILKFFFCRIISHHACMPFSSIAFECDQNSDREDKQNYSMNKSVEEQIRLGQVVSLWVSNEQWSV